MNGIAVILPVYNGERLLESSVRSVFDAGARVREIIIVDDGSTDGTLKKARALAEADGRVRVIHTENQGTYAARRTGIAVSESPYIAFVDADDRYVPGALDRLAALLEKYDADVAVGGIVQTASWDEIVPPPAAAPEERVYAPDEMWPRIMRWRTQEFIGYVWNRLYRRATLCDLLEEHGICQGEDVLITCQVFLKARKTVETTAPVYQYYQRQDSLTHARFGRHDLDLIQVWDHICDMMAGQDEKLRYMAQVNRWRTDFTLICRLILADDREADRQYAQNLRQWRSGLAAHWKDLVKSLSPKRVALVMSIRFGYGPMKLLMRLGKRIMER